MVIAILGGSFDPPHKMHDAIAQHVIDRRLADKIMVMPCAERMNKKLSQDVKRLEMCKLMWGSDKNFIISDLSIKCQESRTLKLFEFILINEKIQSIFHNREPNQYKFIIGDDCAKEIYQNKWYESNRLMEEVPFIVFKRHNNEFLVTCHDSFISHWYYKYPHKYEGYYPNHRSNISSTLIRQRILSNEYKNWETWVDKTIGNDLVVNYIKEHSLYRKPI